MLATQPDGVTVEGETSQVMAGVQWLADQGCKVINMSLGGADRSQSEEALYNQIRKNGTLIVVSSGNDAANHPSFPGRYQSVVTVGAVDKLNKLASFSNTGAQLDLVAPGVDNLSSFPAGQGRDAFLIAGGPTISALSLEFAGATPTAGLTASARELWTRRNAIRLRYSAAGGFYRADPARRVHLQAEGAERHGRGCRSSDHLQQPRERAGQLQRHAHRPDEQRHAVDPGDLALADGR